MLTWDTGAKDEFGAFHAPPNGVLAHGIQPEIFWRVEIQCTVGRHLGEPALDGVAVGNHPTAGFYPVIKLWLLGCQKALIAAALHQNARVMGQLNCSQVVHVDGSHMVVGGIDGALGERQDGYCHTCSQRMSGATTVRAPESKSTMAVWTGIRYSSDTLSSVSG